MIFSKIKIGNQYYNAEENDIKYEILFYDKKKKVLMVKDTQDNIVNFIIGKFKVKDNRLDYDTSMSYTVSDKEFLDCINTYFAQNKDISVSQDLVATAIRRKYYKIPLHLATVVADWYMA